MSEEKQSKSFNPDGRPLLELDENKILAIAQTGATYDEIASEMSCSVDTLERRYQGLIKKGHNFAKLSVRRKMIQMVENGSVPMAIWLSKQWLGMKEPRQEIDFTNAIDEISFINDDKQ